MAWAATHGLAQRFGSLPLVLCGPVLGRTEPDAVTVWVALKEARTVTLRVLVRTPPPSPTSLTERAIGTRSTVRLGDALHVVAVTARPPQDAPLERGEVYFYDLYFGDGSVTPVPDTADALRTTGIVTPPSGSALGELSPSSLSYSLEHRLPSFALPPADLNKLRIVNGSCRKPHAQNLDAMPALDEILAVDWPVADDRPHQLLLMGDQIYADSTPPLLLFLLLDAAPVLLGWNEPLPGVQSPAELAPNKREHVIKDVAGFTTGANRNHVITLFEYVGSHFLGWSHVLWPEVLPAFEDVLPGEPRTERRLSAGGVEEVKSKVLSGFETVHARLGLFRGTVRQVRRALANVPTYMVFDDHDVTDDWNMYRDWAERVFPKPLGRRIMQNALAAFALCQAWTSMPDRFEAGQPGATLLEAVEAWAASGGTDAGREQAIADLVGLPPAQNMFETVVDGERLKRPAGALRWHYTISGPKHDVLVLDARTMRTFPPGAKDPPAHIGMDALDEQIPVGAVPADRITLAIATTNVLTIPWFQGSSFYGDVHQYWHLWLADVYIRRKIEGRYEPDLADSWKLHSAAFEAIVAQLARRATTAGASRTSRIVVLSGEVHFSWAARLQYWGDRPFRETQAVGPANPPIDAVFAFLCSSAFKKDDNPISSMVHDWGYIPMFDELPKPSQWLGWRAASSIGVSAQDVGRMAHWVEFQPWMLRETPPMLGVADLGETGPITVRPDWRYRIDFMLGEKGLPEFKPSSVLANPNPTDHDDWLDVFTDALERHRDYAQKFGDGLEMIGRNTIAELRFHWEGDTTLAGGISDSATSLTLVDSTGFPDAPFRVRVGEETIEVGELDRVGHVCSRLQRGVSGSTAAAHQNGVAVRVAKAVVQKHWWRLLNDGRIQPLTIYTVSLEYDDARYPRPRLAGEVQP